MDIGEEQQHPYWHGQLIVDAALAANDPAAAAAAFHRAISVMPKAITEAEADYASVPADVRALFATLQSYSNEDVPRQKLYPFIGQDAFAFAAVRGDFGSLKILDSMCGSFSEEPKPCSGDYLRLVQTVRYMVSANEVTDSKDLRKALSPTDRERFKSVWRAMRDAKTLLVESQGSKVFFHRSVPIAVSSTWKPTLFRKGKAAAETTLLERPKHMEGRRWEPRPEPTPSFDTWPPATPEEVPVPKEARRSRKSTSVAAGNKTWIQDVTVSKRTDGSNYTPTAVINPDGTLGPTVNLDYYARLRSNPQGDCGISIDRDSVVRIYTPDAEQVLALSLFATPEVRETIRGFGDKGLKTTSAIRSVHASLAAERLVISVINKVFVYSFDEEVIAAFHLDDETWTQVIQAFRISSSKPDWAYFVQLSLDGQGLYIGAYSGLLLHLSFNGQLINSWVLPSAPHFLRENDEGISGCSHSYLFHANRDSGDVHCQFVDARGDIQLVGCKVLFDAWTASGYFDLDRFEGRTVQLPKPRTAAYVANGRLVMQTAASRFIF